MLSSSTDSKARIDNMPSQLFFELNATITDQYRTLNSPITVGIVTINKPRSTLTIMRISFENRASEERVPTSV